MNGGRLMVMDVEGGEVRELLALRDWSLEGARSVQWTPDGEHVLYATPEINEATDVWKVAAAGGEPKKLWTFAEGHYAGAFTISPDGRQIALTVYSQESEVWVMENLKEVLEREP
jgi:Tol biopolymer transport system component